MTFAVAPSSNFMSVCRPVSKRHFNGKAAIDRPQLSLRTRRRVSGPAFRSTKVVVQAAAADAATVKIIVQGRHIEVTPPLKEHAESKVANAVHNYASIIREVDVKLAASGKSGKAKEAHHQREQVAEVTVYTHRYGVVRAEEVAEDCYAAVDLVCDKVKRQLRKVKERAVQKGNWPGRGGPKGGESLSELAEGTEEEERLPSADAMAASIAPEIVREKVFLLEPMSVDEALEQIENVGHDFYIFLDNQTNEVKVIYRRRTHGYGIIIPALTQ